MYHFRKKMPYTQFFAKITKFCTFFFRYSFENHYICNKFNKINSTKMASRNTDNKKRLFLEAYKECHAIISTACEKVGIDRSTAFLWKKDDPEFAKAMAEVEESQIDFVEGKLMSLVDSGDATATIFYLKTKGRGRGYSEKTLQDIPELVVRFVSSGIIPASSEQEVRQRYNLLEGE